MSRAVVIGGSIAGLAAARVLAEHYDEVTIIERDRFPSLPHPRRGTPQDRHAHVLLARGVQELEALFPGFLDQATQAGAVVCDYGAEIVQVQRTQHALAPRQPDGFVTLFATRPCLEAVLRAALHAVAPHVRFVEGVRVTGLMRDRQRIAGVQARGQPGPIAADLVVDASGATSALDTWLRAVDLPPPPTAYGQPDDRTWYASQRVSQPVQPVDRWWRGAVIDFALPTYPVTGYLFPAEERQWVVTLSGPHARPADAPPQSPAAFGALLSREMPLLVPVLADATPSSEVARFIAPRYRYRECDCWPGRPAGLLVVGDALWHAPPIFGQGITLAVLAAAELRRVLATHGPSEAMPHAFFLAMRKWEVQSWAICKWFVAQLPTPATAAVLPPLYFDAMAELLWVAQRDPAVRQRVRQVSNLLVRPDELFAPDMLARVQADRLIRRYEAELEEW